MLWLLAFSHHTLERVVFVLTLFMETFARSGDPDCGLETGDASMRPRLRGITPAFLYHGRTPGLVAT